MATGASAPRTSRIRARWGTPRRTRPSATAAARGRRRNPSPGFVGEHGRLQQERPVLHPHVGLRQGHVARRPEAHGLLGEKGMGGGLAEEVAVLRVHDRPGVEEQRPGAAAAVDEDPARAPGLPLHLDEVEERELAGVADQSHRNGPQVAAARSAGHRRLPGGVDLRPGLLPEHGRLVAVVRQRAAPLWVSQSARPIGEAGFLDQCGSRMPALSVAVAAGSVRGGEQRSKTMVSSRGPLSAACSG